MKYQAIRHLGYGIPARVERNIKITEVTEDRVIGTQVWDNEKGTGTFNVKLRSDAKGDFFYRGSGSGKIRYNLKKAD